MGNNLCAPHNVSYVIHLFIYVSIYLCLHLYGHTIYMNMIIVLDCVCAFVSLALKEVKDYNWNSFYYINNLAMFYII